MKSEIGDCVVFGEDIYLLNEGRWLNDAIIYFYYEYLRLIKFKEYENNIEFMVIFISFIILY